MTHGSLFSGIGGFDLASEWSGWENVFHCEWDEFCQKVLKYYWPYSQSYTDIKKTCFKKYANKIDVLTGGFPCQPFSSAGKRKGTEDDRYLWPEMLRAIQEIQPRYIVGENVYGIINWSGGLVFEQVCVDLENEGYQVQPVILPACGKNAPHKRERVWFIAHCNGKRCNNWWYNWQERYLPKDFKRNIKENKPEWEGWKLRTSTNGENGANTYPKGEQGKQPKSLQSKISNKKQGELRRSSCEMHTKGFVTNSNEFRQQEQGKPRQSMYKKAFREWQASWSYDDGSWPTQSPVCGGNDGIPSELDGITLSKWITESLKAYGNAIVPQVAYEIFKVINQLEYESI